MLVDGQDQHSVPKFLLKRFAKQGFLATRERSGAVVTRVSVKRATTAPDFYDARQRAHVNKDALAIHIGFNSASVAKRIALIAMQIERASDRSFIRNEKQLL